MASRFRTSAGIGGLPRIPGGASVQPRRDPELHFGRSAVSASSEGAGRLGAGDAPGRRRGLSGYETGAIQKKIPSLATESAAVADWIHRADSPVAEDD